MQIGKHVERIVFVFPLLLQTAVWVPIRIIFLVFVRFEVRGLENIKGLKKPVIFAANHSSEWDPILVPASLPFLSSLSSTFYTSRERDFYKKKGAQNFFYGGTWFKIWGAYPVKVGVRNYERSLKHHIRILEEKRGSICIFPEGGKSKDGTIGTAKGGISFLAHRTNTPIVPIAIKGVHGMTNKDFFGRRRKIVVEFGEPIHAEELFEERFYKPEEHKSVASKIMSKIKEIFDKD